MYEEPYVSGFIGPEEVPEQPPPVVKSSASNGVFGTHDKSEILASC